jgi:hypothetical protein
MIVAGSASPLLLSSAGGYNLTKSLRFRNSASAYLNRTGGTSTSRRIHTFSFWTKSSVIGGTRTVLSAGPDDSNREVIFIDSNKFTYQVKISNTFYDLETTQVFRDPAAWYHFVVAIDTTQATDSNRVKIYVNGSQITAFGTAVYPPQNADLFFDDSNGSVSYIGALRGYLGSFNYDGYFAEFNFIDGQALTPSSFGQTSTTTGVWIPKKFSGTYGTNGFYLPFTDTTSTSTLGTDFSGNSNTWTVNNISLTSGSTYDSMNDVPTLTSATVANYAVWNPLVLFPNTTYQATMSNANMLMTRSGGGQGGAVTTIGTTSGKFYAEMPVTAVGGSVTKLGVMATDNPPSISAGSEYALGDTSASVAYRSNGARLTGGTTTNSWGSTYTTGDVIGVAFDADTGKIWFAKNGTWQASGDPAAGTNPATTLATGAPFYFSAGGESGISISLNCGQQPFTYTPPTGFVALNTFNLPTPTIGATASTTANKYMDVTTYTGNGGTQSVTNSGSMQPDFLWIKPRSTANSHVLSDSVRGTDSNGYLFLVSDGTYGESTFDTTWHNSFGKVTALNSNGFTVVDGSSSGNVNTSSVTYVGWQWRASNATAVTNTSGSISSQVSANTTAGFSIVTYTGTGANATVGHGLGVAPKMIIIKNRGDVSDWAVWHTGLSGNSYYIYLNKTSAQSNVNAMWNNTAPTSTVFSLGTSTDSNDTKAMVAYCFAQIAGYSAFGSYTGNGSATAGPFVYLGFRPRFVMVKRYDTSSTGNWSITDTAINPYNNTTGALRPNTADSESTVGTVYVQPVSNGFYISNNNSDTNASSGTYIYMAFAENPFKYANAR